MRILLIANYLPDAQESMQRFTNLLESGLRQLGHEVRVSRPAPVLVRHSNHANSGMRKWFGYIDKFILFPPLLRRSIEWSDVAHICDHSNSFYVHSLRRHPHLVTCHDMLAIRSAIGDVPQNPVGASGRLLQRTILHGLTCAQHVACVSEATRTDLLKLSPIPASRTSLIYNGPNYPYSRMSAAEAAQRLVQLGISPDQAFLLHIGGNQWYKNRLGLLRIFARVLQLAPGLNLKLVSAGKPWTSEMRAFASDQNLNDSVVELQNVSEENLRALYSTARLMLFPSLQEGFGWPIIEAQACGCPVITSGRVPMTEIGGHGAIYIDPENIEAAAQTVICSLNRFEDIRLAGLQNALRFDSSKMVCSYLSVYNQLISERKSTAISKKLSHLEPEAAIDNRTAC